jgi:hypothetical protein
VQVRIIRQVLEGLSLEVATPDEAREILQPGAAIRRRSEVRLAFPSFVIPAKAGIQGNQRGLRPWIPAFAGMRRGGGVPVTE